MSSMNRNMSSEQSVDETVDGAQDQRPLEPQSSDDYELEAAEKESTPTPSADTTTAEPSEPVRQIPRSEATAKRGELDTHLSDEVVLSNFRFPPGFLWWTTHEWADVGVKLRGAVMECNVLN
jgi:hypothetical protein